MPELTSMMNIGKEMGKKLISVGIESSETVDLVYTKYLKALIYYDGIQRIEQFMFPQEANKENGTLMIRIIVDEEN